MTHEHYLQTVLTTIKPSGSPAPFNVYEYTQHSLAPVGEGLPRAKFHSIRRRFRSALSEGEAEVLPLHHHADGHRPGVYSVMGIADGFVHNSIQAWKKKELGKFG